MGLGGTIAAARAERLRLKVPPSQHQAGGTAACATWEQGNIGLVMKRSREAWTTSAKRAHLVRDLAVHRAEL